MTNKKCPMKNDGIQFGFCDAGSCGWWNPNLGECSIASISAVAFMVGKINETIHDKKAV